MQAKPDPFARTPCHRLGFERKPDLRAEKASRSSFSSKPFQLSLPGTKQHSRTDGSCSRTGISPASESTRTSEGLHLLHAAAQEDVQAHQTHRCSNSHTFHLGSMVEATTKPTILSEKSFLKPTNYPQTPHGGRDEHQLLFSKAGVLSSFASSSIIRQQGVKASLGPANVEQDFQTKRACVLPSFRDIDNSHAKDGPSASLSCKPQS